MFHVIECREMNSSCILMKLLLKFLDVNSVFDIWVIHKDVGEKCLTIQVVFAIKMMNECRSGELKMVFWDFPHLEWTSQIIFIIGVTQVQESTAHPGLHDHELIIRWGLFFKELLLPGISNPPTSDTSEADYLWKVTHAVKLDCQCVGAERRQLWSSLSTENTVMCDFIRRFSLKSQDCETETRQENQKTVSEPQTSQERRLVWMFEAVPAVIGDIGLIWDKLFGTVMEISSNEVMWPVCLYVFLFMTRSQTPVLHRGGGGQRSSRLCWSICILCIDEHASAKVSSGRWCRTKLSPHAINTRC